MKPCSFGILTSPDEFPLITSKAFFQPCFDNMPNQEFARIRLACFIHYKKQSLLLWSNLIICTYGNSNDRF